MLSRLPEQTSVIEIWRKWEVESHLHTYSLLEGICINISLYIKYDKKQSKKMNINFAVNIIFLWVNILCNEILTLLSN